VILCSGRSKDPDRRVDLLEIVLAADTVLLGDLMAFHRSPTQLHDQREDLAELFVKYQFHMIPVVDE